MTTRLADRLAAARRRRFVGREHERKLFESAVMSEQPAFSVLHVYGPGGVGKTSLLREFATIAANHGLASLYLDGRNLEPTPDSFVNGLCQALGTAPPQNVFDLLINHAERTVLLIDTYESLQPLDSWLRDVFLPQVPANTLVVMAGRQPPAMNWRTDPGWDSLVQLAPLRNLTPAESRAYLDLRTVPGGEHEQILSFTHGHPLAISLVADLLDQHPHLHLDQLNVPDVVRSLLQRLVQDAPTANHRLALEACALARHMTEGLLAEMLQQATTNESAHAYFDWLRSLSFMEAGRHGLFPHDLVREAITLDLRWRNPDLYTELHRRARDYYHKRLYETQGQQQHRVLNDLLFLHRENAVVRQFYDWQESDSLYTDRARPQDKPALIDMVRKHEGDAAADLAAFWLDSTVQHTIVIRNAQQQVLGFVMRLALHDASQSEIAHDPATLMAWSFLQRRAALRSNEQAAYFRFWMDNAEYQDISTVQSRLFMACVQYYLTTPTLAYSLFPCADPDFYAGIFAYADLHRISEADFTVDGRRFGLYGHDWRLMPAAAWLDLLAEREIAITGGPPLPAEPPPPAQPVVVLSEPDFASAVRLALRYFTQPNELQQNPLLRSRLVLDKVGNEANNAVRAQALHTLIKETAAQLQASPKLNKLYRAVHHTYLQPAATQELAAELLDLPFSTYRRHLKEGIDVIVETLWQRELGGGL